MSLKIYMQECCSSRTGRGIHQPRVRDEKRLAVRGPINGKRIGPILHFDSVFGEPLVARPRDAVRSYFCSGIDALVIENLSFLKPEPISFSSFSPTPHVFLRRSYRTASQLLLDRAAPFLRS